MSFKSALAVGFLYPVSIISVIGGTLAAFLGPTMLYAWYVTPSPNAPLWPVVVTLIFGCVLACMFITVVSEVLHKV